MINSSLTSLSFLCLTLAAAACGPQTGTSDTDASTTSDPCDSDACETSTSTTDATVTTTEGPLTTTTTETTTDTVITTSTDACQSGTCGDTDTTPPGSTCATECDSTTDTDTEGPPSKCAPGAGDLSVAWQQTDPRGERGEAVAAGAGRVAWVTGNVFNASQLRVLDVDGDLLWEEPLTLMGGEGEITFKDLAIDPAGAVVLAGTTPNMDGVVRWFDSDGALQDEDVFAGVAPDEWAGVALLADGDLVVAGATVEEEQDHMLVRRYGADGTPVWSEMFSEMGAAWSSDARVTSTGTILISGHSNQNPGPVLLAYDGDGALQWSHIAPGGQPLQVAWGVAADSTGRAFLAVSHADGTGRVDRFDAAGALESSSDLDFAPRAIAVDADDVVVVLGTIHQSDTVIVERRDATDNLLVHHERPGTQALGLAVDAECHTYVTGVDVNIAWLDKLN
jgi:hypothetical protein